MSFLWAKYILAYHQFESLFMLQRKDRNKIHDTFNIDEK